MFALGHFFRGTSFLSAAPRVPVSVLRGFHVCWAAPKVADVGSPSPLSFQDPANTALIKTIWRWTPEEDLMLRELRSQGLSHKAISERLNRRTAKACVTRWSQLRLCPSKPEVAGYWKPEEDTQILNAREVSVQTGSPFDLKGLALSLGRSKRSVRHRVEHLGWKHTKRVGAWTAVEMEFLKSGVAAAAAAGQPVRWAELAAVLKRSPSSLPMKFERLESIVNRAWSKDDDKCLEQYVSEASSSGSGIHWTSIARRLKRTSQATRLRWSSFLDPEMKHGAWSPSESDTLRKLVNEAQLAGRAPRWREWENVIKRPAKELCRYWHVHLRPTSKPSRTPFSLEEDKMIEKMLKEAKENRCNPSWILIGETLGRSRESVRKRARQLNRLAAALQK